MQENHYPQCGTSVAVATIFPHSMIAKSNPLVVKGIVNRFAELNTDMIGTQLWMNR